MARGGLNSAKQTPVPDAIQRWPAPPPNFAPPEVAAWNEIGEGLRVLGTASRADLILVRITARTLARLDAILVEPGELKTTAVNSLARLVADLLNRLGLSPQARATVGSLPKKTKKSADPLDEFES